MATMNPEQMLALSEIFGECGLHPIPELRHPEIEKLIILAANNGEPVADDDPTGDDRVGAIPWHTDLIYTEALNRGALLRAVKTGTFGFEELKGVALSALDAIAGAAVKAGVGSLFGGSGSGGGLGERDPFTCPLVQQRRA